MFLRLILLCSFISFFFPQSTLAQEDAHKLKINVNRPLRVDYLAPSWNKDPLKIETAAIVIRDAVSGRLAKIEMQETSANSAFFRGTYQLNFQGDEKAELTPEVYIVPLAMLQADPQLTRLDSLIHDGTLLRKPYFLRTERKNQILSVFDSRAQAMQAYESYLQTGLGRPVIDPAAFDAQRTAQKNNDSQNRLQKEAASESLRTAMEAEERRKQDELKKQSAAMGEAEKATHRKEALALANEAMALYQKENYKGAETKFDQAIALDPENTSYYFQYGVTLYRLEKYNSAIVKLRLAKGPGVNPNERDYYIGLSHMKLKEYEKSYKVFTEIKGRNDKALSGSSAFFAGVIDFQKENYDKSKSHFEYVLDNSTDPKMDQQAESYIEQIANIKQFEEMRKKKIILSANLGLMYDSNILSIPSANASTGLGGYRWAYGVSGEYRPIFSEKNEFSGILSVSDMYSMDNSFIAKKEFQNNDPQIWDLSFPYKWKGVTLGKPAQLGITPAYETIIMDINGTGNRTSIVNSTILKGDGTFVMNEDVFANYAVEVRHDDSQLTATSAENQTANKITLSTSQTHFQDKKKTRATIVDAALADNMALGSNQTYQRIDLAGSYLMPGVWETAFVSRLSAAYAVYPDHDSKRKDQNYGLTLVLQKQLNEDFAANLTGSYSISQSNVSTYQYDKYMIMSGINWKRAF